MNFPPPFTETIQSLLLESSDMFFDALRQPSPVSIRANIKIPFSPSEEKVEWCPQGYYLNERPLFTADPFFHAGVYYVQEASSMFLFQALEQLVAKDSVILDVSAAPGGKSTLISQFLASDGLLISNEINRSRAEILAENTIKWGNCNTIVTNNNPSDFRSFSSFFDAIVVDAPCSGEGMFRKDKNAVAEWSVENVAMCAVRQKDILEAVWDSLKPNGYLIYSTCTFNKKENEKNIEWMIDELEANLVSLDCSKFPSVVKTDFGYRFYPHKIRGEGFFLSVVQKTDENGLAFSNPSKKEKQRENKEKIDERIKKWIVRHDEFEFFSMDTILYAISKQHIEKWTKIRKNLKILYAGVALAEKKGDDFVPHIGLALSKLLNRTEFQSVEVDKITALRYLKGETIFIPEAKRGYLLLVYEAVPIGWVKNVGNRCNNLYPSYWRIRMNLDLLV